MDLPALDPSPAAPPRRSPVLFAAKAWGLRARRAAVDVVHGPPRLRRALAAGFDADAAASRTPLWGDEGAGERGLQRGKVENLRVAARALDGVVIPAGAVFSFWRQLGPPGASRGFVHGRMLRQGCLEPVVGGGLCQLSNALYEVALQAGCTILERHAHSRVVPGSAAALGRDATVAWNYVDLRFSPRCDLRLGVRLETGALAVTLRGRPGDRVASPAAGAEASIPGKAARSCASCGETGCSVHARARRRTPDAAEHAVFLLDEAWPELQDYVRAARRPGDRLGASRLDDRLEGLCEDFAGRFEAPVSALHRSLAIRAAGRQGARRRRAEIASAGRIAAALARRLGPDAVALTVAQAYLPQLWRTGRLGGRELTVLMTRPPAAVLHARLDAAFAAHPDRPSLADFRAPAELVESEALALAHATRIVTPHAEIAALFGARAVRLPWRRPDAPAAPPAPREGPIRRIAFAGPTLARKGAHAVREAALRLGLEVAPLGSQLEGEGFWRDVRALAPGAAVDAMVAPALVEEQPRRLLAALAAGVRVFASPACGLDPQPGLVLIPPDDGGALAEALVRG